MSDDTTMGTSGVTPKPFVGSRLSRGLAAAILLIVVIAAALWLLLPKPTTVPDVTGGSLEIARTAIENTGYKVGVVTNKESDKTAPGIVTAQSPVGGTVAHLGTAVDLTVAIAPTGVSSSTTSTAGGQGASRGGVTVPNVIGKSRADADTSISGSGLLVAHTSEAAPAPVGTVVSQFPQAGTQVPAGSVVDVVLSTGLGSGTSSIVSGGRTVPSVLGLTLSSAQNTLSRAGWSWSVQYGPGTAVPGGVVYFQSPAADALVSSRQTVALWVSTGSATHGSPYARPPLNDHPGW